MLKNIAMIVIGIVMTARLVSADEAPAPATNFPKGSFALTLEADYGHSFDLSPARFESGSLGVDYYFFDNFALGIEASGFSVQQPGPDSIITDLDIKLRHHLFNSGAFSLYFDAAGGVSYSTERTPRIGTYYNYTVECGPGVAWKLREHLFLTGGVRYWHLSNARLEGPTHNPSINALEGYVGMIMTF